MTRATSWLQKVLSKVFHVVVTLGSTNVSFTELYTEGWSHTFYVSTRSEIYIHLDSSPSITLSYALQLPLSPVAVLQEDSFPSFVYCIQNISKSGHHCQKCLKSVPYAPSSSLLPSGSAVHLSPEHIRSPILFDDCKIFHYYMSWTVAPKICPRPSPRNIALDSLRFHNKAHSLCKWQKLISLSSRDWGVQDKVPSRKFNTGQNTEAQHDLLKDMRFWDG